MAVTRAQPFGPRALRSPAIRDGLAAFLGSRAIVWLVGMSAFLILPLSGWQHTDPTGLTRHLGAVGEVLGAPAVRWDSSYYVFTAQHGYEALGQTAFFPFYPLVMRAVATVTYSEVVAGVLVSLVSFAVALLLMYLYGPRADRPSTTLKGVRPLAARLRPRYRLRADALWLLLIPAGLVVFAVYTWIAYDSPFAS